MPDFARSLIVWQRKHGRSGLPWQGTRDPYRIWLAEVMLQQTQVDAVIPFYERFVARFPDVNALARASQEEVLRLWSGLGYYARARNLHAAARIVAREYSGRFPAAPRALEALPGVGRSSAAAIAAFAFDRRAAILDGNVRRVLARCFGIAGYPGERAVERRLWSLAESLLPRRSIAAYTQALMDLGATVCLRARPRCADCPVSAQCVALGEGRVAQLPQPRPRKIVPLRRSTWLLLLSAGCVLLERRPPAGVWGGLWTFPELPRGSADPGDARAYCRRELGCEVAAMRRLPPLEHAFTHFRLRARPIRCSVRAVAPRAAAPGRIWLELENAAHAAVPVPVRKLIQDLIPSSPAGARRAPC
ncbi:MAG: A/G-specific adenine glycosylase [Burkholderiales bacterium]